MDTIDRNSQSDGNQANLLQAIPHPVAVVRASDGCILTANRPFCSNFKLPTNVFIEKADMDPSLEQYRIRRVTDGTIALEDPQTGSTCTEADVRPLHYQGQNCWLVTTPVDAGRDVGAAQPFKEDKDYRSLVENLNDILYTTDEKAVVTYVSPNIRQFSGYSPSEVIGRNFVEFVHPEDLPERMEQFERILGGIRQATEYRLFTKDGDIRWARTNARPIRRGGRVVGVQGILVDITDRKMIEAALVQSEEKYRILIQHAKDAIFVLQGDHCKFMNPVATEILGYTYESIAERPFIEFVHPDDRPMIMDRYVRRLRGEELPDRMAFRILNKDNDVRDVDLNSVLITWDNKPAVLNFLRDVTVQKLMEAHLRNTQKMEALGTLAGGIAHNFNNLLMGIHGNVSLSLMNMDPSENARKYIQKIDRLVNSGASLTSQLLDYARGSSCEISSVDINALARDAAETLMATKKHIRIHFQLSGDIPCITADRSQIEQVLLNLLLNAADAMPDGGDVRVETTCLSGREVKQNAILDCNRDYVRLKISDRGPGIPEKIRDRIFEPFFTTKGMGNGTGLGLSTAYGIARNHGGMIAVESEVNAGSSFLVYLPLSTNEATPEEKVEMQAVVGHGTVLLVDDEDSVIDATAELLELMGFNVLTARDGAQALEQFRRHWRCIDLVILDLILPDISGREVFDKLKATDPAVKVLLSSGFSLAGQAEELIASGCRGFIQKPYHIDHLSAQLKKILSVK